MTQVLALNHPDFKFLDTPKGFDRMKPAHGQVDMMTINIAGDVRIIKYNGVYYVVRMDWYREDCCYFIRGVYKTLYEAREIMEWMM